MIHKMVVSMIWDKPLCSEDITQEIFLKALDKQQTFKGFSSVKTWLYRIARNTVIDALRKNRIRSLYHINKGKDDGLNSIMETSPSPEEEIEQRDKKNIIQQALSKLPLKFRLVLVYREIHKLSYSEMAEILGVTEGTVKSRLFYARRMLYEQLRYINMEL